MHLPDLESENSLALAPYYEALDKIEDIVEDGKYTAPDSTDDLNSTMRLAAGSYNKFKRMGLEPEKLMMLLRLIDDCNYLLNPPLETPALPASGPQPEAIPQGLSELGAMPSMAPPPTSQQILQ
jgi:hypothetical protein